MPDSPYRYVIAPGEGMARVWLVGRVDAESKKAALSALRADPDWQAGTGVLWDCVAADETDILPTDVPPMLDAMMEDPDGVDVFYGAHDVAYMIAKLFALLERTRGKHARVVGTIADACEVLGCTRLPPSLRDPADRNGGGAANEQVA
jgi:hypothetical protein